MSAATWCKEVCRGVWQASLRPAPVDLAIELFGLALLCWALGISLSPVALAIIGCVHLIWVLVVAGIQAGRSGGCRNV